MESHSPTNNYLCTKTKTQSPQKTIMRCIFPVLSPTPPKASSGVRMELSGEPTYGGNLGPCGLYGSHYLTGAPRRLIWCYVAVSGSLVDMGTSRSSQGSPQSTALKVARISNCTTEAKRKPMKPKQKVECIGRGGGHK